MIDVDVFIEAIKQRPALYNPGHEHYTRKEVRARLWNEIGLIVHPDWMTIDERYRRAKTLLMQKKWKSLKDCFNRELRLRRVRDPNKARKSYEFFDKLTFLLFKQPGDVAHPPRLSHHPDHHLSPFQEVSIKSEVSEEPASDLQQLQQPFALPLLPPLQEAPHVQAARKRRAAEEARKEDGDKLFLLSFLKDLKRLPMSTKYWVKMKFSEIMHQAAMSLDGVQDDYDDEEDVDEEDEFPECVLRESAAYFSGNS